MNNHSLVEKASLKNFGNIELMMKFAWLGPEDLVTRTIRMMVLLTLTTGFLLSPKPAWSEIEVNDAAEDWLECWERSSSQSERERVKLFEAKLKTAAPELYEPLLGYVRDIKKIGIDDKILENLREFSSIESDFRKLHRRLKAELPQHLRTFSRQFPNFDPKSVKVYLCHSLGESNGAVYPGQPIVFFLGLDMMLKHNRYSDQAPFINHEFFHAYHAQQSPLVQELFGQLWYEGLAVFVTAKMYPQASLTQLQLNRSEIVQSRKKMGQLLDRLEAELENTAPAVKYKFFNIGSRDEEIPRRCGYYLGYLLAQEIGKDRSLEELVALQPEEVLSELRRALGILKSAHWKKSHLFR